MSFRICLLLIVPWLVAAGCSDPPAGPADSAGDISSETSQDTPSDGVVGDTAQDTTTDTTADVASDTTPDLGPDSPTVDGGTDTTVADTTGADAVVADVPVADGTETDTAGDTAPSDTPIADVPVSDGAGGDSVMADAIADAATDIGAADTASDVVPDVPPPVEGCPTYHEFCNGECVNTAASATNCGGCGTTCTSPEVCSAGQCKDACLTGLSPCNGTCVNTDADVNNCGSCGDPCGDGLGCVNGNCHPALDLGDPPAQCSGFESPIVLEDGGVSTCLGEQAQIEFTWAVCTCDTFTAQSKLFTDAYNSTEGPYEPGQIGGGVGANGTFTVSNDSTIGGSLFVSASTGASSSNVFDILGELHSGGPVSSSGGSLVGYDAFVAGNLNGTIDVQGTLHTPSTSTIGGQVTYGALVNEPVTVEPPCRCGDKIPVSAIAAQYATNNDNALIGLDPAALVNPSGKLYVELPCGIYYLDSIQTGMDLTIVATGRVALMIGGDLNASNKLTILPAPSGELDIFVGGTIAVANNVTLGSPNYPALMRIYVGSSAPLVFNNNATMGAFMYAAHSGVEFNNNTVVYGGLIANTFDAKNSFDVHYDRGVLQAGTDCPGDPGPGGTCTSCADCGNQACVDGTCGECATSADCCSPLICAGGQCISLSITP